MSWQPATCDCSVAALARAKQQKRGVLLLIGGHVAKVGLGPLVVEWLRRGIVTHVALNGAAAIHDFELAAFGETSEDVESGLADGSFGMAEETGAAMNQAASEAARGDFGLGEGLADALSRRSALPGAEASILLGARQAGVPITVHVALGSDVIHQHPSADGAALGATSHRDFKRLAASLSNLDDGGVVINLGSAVILPEVFVKALSVARNLDQGRPSRVRRRRLRHATALPSSGERGRTTDPAVGYRDADHRTPRNHVSPPHLGRVRSSGCELGSFPPSWSSAWPAPSRPLHSSPTPLSGQAADQITDLVTEALQADARLERADSLYDPAVLSSSPIGNRRGGVPRCAAIKIVHAHSSSGS